MPKIQRMMPKSAKRFPGESRSYFAESITLMIWIDLIQNQHDPDKPALSGVDWKSGADPVKVEKHGSH
ncbi:hypothetical protein [Phyllobacterium phragmitis]|uniref:hypothetical protein n=1 Tax=Phyllobacterium phragmitis TaxID=2670329 RepID=UPI0011B2963E|nr:hypothetical protein [Phyllobacterium phragmitis]